MENSRSTENTQHRRSNSTRRQSVHRKRSFCEHCNHSREVKEDNDDIKEVCIQTVLDKISLLESIFSSNVCKENILATLTIVFGRQL